MIYEKITDSEGKERYLLEAETKAEAKAACELISALKTLQAEAEETRMAIVDIAGSYEEVVEPLTALAALLKTE